jgi:L-ribulokinase
VVAGIHKDVPAAQKAMGGGFEKEYHPDPVRADKYKVLFERYRKLGLFIEGKQIDCH